MNPREHSRGLTDSPSPDKDKERERIKAEVDAWLAAGNVLTLIPNGVSGVPEKNPLANRKTKAAQRGPDINYKKIRVEDGL